MIAAQLQAIAKEYTIDGQNVAVLRDVTLELAAGSSLGIMGPSGSGKSTILHILGTLDTPTRGSVELFGQNPLQFTEAQRCQFRREQLGFIFQDHHTLPQLTCFENILLPLYAGGQAPSAVERERARELAHLVGLEHRLQNHPPQLSGGERQRTAIARALVRNPKLILADEPTGNLDQSAAHTVMDLLTSLQTRFGAALVVVTHSAEICAKLGRQLSMVDGRLVERS
ncbi:MAG: ABC transporter ATP-binding protein [Gemmataceae bacterium]